MAKIDKQKDFFKEVVGLKHSDKKAIKVYEDLVFHRFYEVISSANPIFSSIINDEKFKKSISLFIKNGAKTDFIWQMPNEFRKFLKKEKIFLDDMPFLNNLLWFEWIEIELFMKDYTKFKKDKFSLKHKYSLSKSAKIKKLSYKVYEKEFENKGIYPILAYYDMEKKEVVFREISPFMYDFLKLISKMNIKNSIKTMAKRYEIDIKELKEILVTPLKELCSLGIINKRD